MKTPSAIFLFFLDFVPEPNVNPVTCDSTLGRSPTMWATIELLFKESAAVATADFDYLAYDLSLLVDFSRHWLGDLWSGFGGFDNRHVLLFFPWSLLFLLWSETHYGGEEPHQKKKTSCIRDGARAI